MSIAQWSERFNLQYEKRIEESSEGRYYANKAFTMIAKKRIKFLERYLAIDARTAEVL